MHRLLLHLLVLIIALWIQNLEEVVRVGTGPRGLDLGVQKFLPITSATVDDHLRVHFIVRVAQD